MHYENLADRALAGELLPRQQALAVLQAPEQDLDAILAAAAHVREHHFGRRVKVCVLLNAQSGICPEDCAYCSQSKISEAPVAKYKLLRPEEIFARAVQATRTGARRFCVVIAARGPQEKDVATLEAAARLIKGDPRTRHLEICNSLGLLTEDQCLRLKDAGVEYVNHNLNTSERYYGEICHTHSYEDRLRTLRAVQQAGLRTCSGGIVGMGESLEDVVEMGLALRELDIDSIPINFLLPIGGTPLQHQPQVRAQDGLKVLCLMRLLNPSKEVRVAAGRESTLGPLQAQALQAANSLFVDGYLTTPGDPAASVRQWIEAAGYEVEA